NRWRRPAPVFRSGPGGALARGCSRRRVEVHRLPPRAVTSRAASTPGRSRPIGRSRRCRPSCIRRMVLRPGSSEVGIPQVTRHATLLRLAGGLRARGLTEGSILTDLAIVNKRHCLPPLDRAELEKLASWAGTKPPGFRGEKVETSAEVELGRFAEVRREPVAW